MQIILIGAGHTHVHTLYNAHRLVHAGANITVVSPEAEHPYSGMAPGLLGGTYTWQDIALPVRTLAQRRGASFVQERVVRVDPDAQVVHLSDARVLPYDILSINTGSVVHHATTERARRTYTAKPIAELARLHTDMCATVAAGGPGAARAPRVAVVGGGPAGVECAGNAAQLLRRLSIPQPDVHLYTRSTQLARMTPRRSAWIEAFLHEHHVAVHQQTVENVSDVDADFVVVATGTRPPEHTGDFGLPRGQGGGIAVTSTLQSTDYANVFAVGDCADFLPQALDRVGVYAVRMQQVLFHNMHALLKGTPGRLREFRDTGPYLAGVNLGFGRGLLYRGVWELRGRPAFVVKDFIDRRFMERYSHV